MGKERIALAYSGGLDTSVIIPWLKEHYNCEVIAVAIDVGQGEELAPLKEKAIKTGASKIFIEDAKEEYINDFAFPALKAGAKYENKYLLGTATARPVIAKRLVKVALREGCTAIAHGCTGKGNDQVCFELTIKKFAPEMRVVAPWRLWDIKGRKEEIEYAKEKNIPLQFPAEETYSRDRNLWHLSHEGLDLENPRNEPKSSLYQINTAPDRTPDEPDYVEIGFEKGIPVSVNGKKLGPVELVKACNDIGKKHAIGIEDMIENRLVGIKCRGVYETPGGTILYDALEYLESLTLDRDTMHLKQQLAHQYADIVYDGKWYTPAREALAAAVDVIQQNTTGAARLKLFKGRTYHAGVKSPFSMYDPILATFEADQIYNQNDAAGFISLFSLPIKVRALLDQKTDMNARRLFILPND